MAKTQVLTREQLELLILETNLESAQIRLEMDREANAKFVSEKAARTRNNKQRQATLAEERRTKAEVQQQCLHKQGGHPDNILKGSGPSCLTKSRMLDGRTWLIQCNRCELKMLTPHPSGAKKDPARYAAEMEYYNRLVQECDSNGLAPILGCTFDFMQDGVSILPQLA